MGKSNYFKSSSYVKRVRFGGNSKVSPKESEAKKKYKELIGGITLKTDEEFMNLIIKNRDTWRHRVTCMIGLQHNNRTIAEVEMQSVLIEHGYESISYWIGQTLNYFPQQVVQFANHMKGKGIKSIKVAKQLANGDKEKKVQYVDLRFEMS